MAKISELQNEKILKNILKYKKIIDQLYKERALRLQKDPSLKTVLLTKEEQNEIEEIEKKQQQENKNYDSSDIFHLSFDDEEIASMQEKADAAKKSSSAEQNMQITQVLKLTPDQLKEFNTKKK